MCAGGGGGGREKASLCVVSVRLKCENNYFLTFFLCEMPTSSKVTLDLQSFEDVWNSLYFLKAVFI